MRRAIVFVSSTAIGILGYFLIRKLRTPHLNPCPLGYLHIYVGSETGHTLGLAERLASEAKKFSFTPRVIPLEDFRPMDFTKHDYCVILCSTNADGEPPRTRKTSSSGWRSARGTSRSSRTAFLGSAGAMSMGVCRQKISKLDGRSGSHQTHQEGVSSRRLLGGVFAVDKRALDGSPSDCQELA